MMVNTAESESLSTYICSLDDAADEASVGGKAWSLSRMLRLGMRVPQGFVVNDCAFQHFLDNNRLRGRIREFVNGVELSNVQSLQRASRSIQEIVKSAVIPVAVLEAVRKAHRQMGSSQILIVRSSAVGEDSKSASFAGQLDSCRNVCSTLEVEQALVRCWASCWSERALYYQLSRSVHIEQMGVIVQQEIQPKAAGVLFTISPDLSISASEMVCEYCLGHGEDLVSGRINPGRFTVSRDGFGFQFLAEPAQSCQGPDLHYRLAEATIQNLQQIGLLLECEFQGAQDIEWAIDQDEHVHIVQSRPITIPTLARQKDHTRSMDSNAPAVVWSNANINENYPDPVSPFLYSMAADGYYHYFRNLAHAFGIAKSRIQQMEGPLRGVIGVHGAHLYYNLSNIHAILRMVPFGEHLVESFNVFVGASERTASSSSEGFIGQREGRMEKIAELSRIILKIIWQFLFLDRRVTAFERTADEYAVLTRSQNLEQLSLAKLHLVLESFLNIRYHRWTNASLADAASMIGYGILKRMLGRAFPDREHSALHNKLLQGLPDLVSARPVSELWLLSRRVRTIPGLRELFQTADSEEIWTALRSDVRFAGFLQKLENYLEKWGFRCSRELMLTEKNFQEDPRGVLSLLKNYVELDGESPVAALQRQEEERLTETRRVICCLRKRKFKKYLPWPHEGTVLKLVLRWTQVAISLRERARLKQSLLYSCCRRVMLRLGDELTLKSLLYRQEDVFFLTHHEISALISGIDMFPYSVGALIKFRKREHTKLCAMRPPDTFVLKEGAYLPLNMHTEGQEQAGQQKNLERQMTGTGACGGSVTARATVLSDVMESGLLRAGDILVTRQTDPGWAPVFFLVSGLVMERGGMLSHGAIVAREYGIPTVVGVQDATRKIRSGQTLSVDGDTGCVRILD